MDVDRSVAPPRTSVWLLAWAAVGAAICMGFLSILTIGVVLLVLGGAGGVLLLRSAVSRTGWPGLVVGAALPLLYVAFLNRGGPGTVCTTTALEQRCDQQWSPWPWVGAAVLLAVVFVALLRWRSQSAEARLAR